MATEFYTPTVNDRLHIKPDPDMFKVSGDQVFATLQGEGVTAGSPSVFLRLHFCNLACGKTGGWKCDTGYTWDKGRAEFWQEPVDWTFTQTVEEINKAWNEKFINISDSEKRLVVTGGEPLLQQRKIIELRKLLPKWKVEIETNGTITPLSKLADCQINCSPKLSNSGNSKDRRFRPETLKAINAMPNSWFKFVVISPEDLIEIEELVNSCGLNPEKILIMPEGHTKDATDIHLQVVEKEVEKRGWKVTKRNQLEWYGNKRRT